ncbi:MAG: hypothetical protein PHY48_01830 [Candidatus Cloacimonetes bacterium]|nr:hypothetical protein [Candidatus Cloacimonadota bacterium]
MSLYGGYLELELASGKEYHRDCFRLNSGRNALEFLLQGRKYRKVYIPYYTCNVLLTPILRTGVEYGHYSINRDLQPVIDFSSLMEDEAIVVTNYFGLLDDYIRTLPVNKANIIMDNAQAFYAKPMEGMDTFYSPRKFFGIPDGSYLYLKKNEEISRIYKGLDQDKSWDRCRHLLKRLDNQVGDGYTDFKILSPMFQDLPLRKMSTLTTRLLDSIDYDWVKAKRRENFQRVHSFLGKYNNLELPLKPDCVPMAYPLLTNQKGLRAQLIEMGVFVPQYWDNVAKWSEKGSLELDLAENLLAVPIDQRYNVTQIDAMLGVLLKNIIK